MSGTEPDDDAPRTGGADGAGAGDRDVVRWTLVRSLLVPMWEVTHAQWGGPVPSRPSQGMDRRTAEFVRLLSWTRWEVVTGLVIGPDGRGVAHAWNEHADGGFVDLCGDGLGFPPVQVRTCRPPGYIPSPCVVPGPVDAYRARAVVWLLDLHRQSERVHRRRSDVVFGCPLCGRWEQIADAICSPGLTSVWCCSVCAVPGGPASGLHVPGAVYGDGTPVPAGLFRPACTTATSEYTTSEYTTSVTAAQVPPPAGPGGRGGQGGGGTAS